MLIISVTFSVLTCVIFWSLIEQGNHNVRSMTNYTFQNLIYVFIVVMIFLTLINIDLDFRL